MTEPLDMSKDPDRFQADAGPSGPLNPAADPDRFVPPAPRGGHDQTLPELLGDGAQEESRDNLTWLLGLVGVIAFLLLVSLILQLG